MGRVRIPHTMKIIRARERLVKLGKDLQICEENIQRSKANIDTEQEKIKYYTKLKDVTRRLLTNLTKPK